MTTSAPLFARFIRASFCLSALVVTTFCGLAEAAPQGSPPNNGRVISPGHVPGPCAAEDGPYNETGATNGYYWSETAKAWISAPYCHAVWRLMTASPSQIAKAGDTVTVTAIHEDGNVAAHIPTQGGMSWAYPGTLVSGCGSKDLTCTVKIGDADAPPEEWAWHQFHVSSPGRAFILPPSYGRCPASEPCLDTRTNAWSYVGIMPEEGCTAAASLNGRPNTSAAVCKQLGVTWTMDPHLKYQAWDTIDGVIPPQEVKRKEFFVDLILKNGKDKYTTCPSNRTYKWKLTAPKGKKANIAGEGCFPKLYAKEQGNYKVSVKEFDVKTGKPTGREVRNAPVIVQDWLVVGMGDSNGSGQGTDVAGDGYAYEFPQCDRGIRSYQYKVAKMLEDADDKTSVTFIHTACSGARTVHMFGKKYVGQEVDFGNPLPPQIKQLQRRIGGKENMEVDAVILSIGINDALFGGILGNCLSNTSGDCHTKTYRPFNNPATGGEPDMKPAPEGGNGTDTMENIVGREVGRLNKLYQPIGRSFKELGIQAKRIFLTSYPDAMTDDTGQICGDAFAVGMSANDWAWLNRVAGQLLGQVLRTASDRRWTPVGTLGEPFLTHGYCASDSWFQGPAGSIADQGNKFGTFHSKEQGHGEMANIVFAALCQQMYGNDDCKDALPRPPKN